MPAEKQVHLERVIGALARRRSRAPRHGLGTSPAVVAIDLQVAFLSSYGTRASAAAERTESFLQATRKQNVPVVHVTLGVDDLADANPRWRTLFDLTPFLPDRTTRAIDDRFVETSDVHLEKSHASGFFGTPLHALLSERSIDTVVVVGVSTSGCVRATAVDAAALGYHCVVLEDCVTPPGSPELSPSLTWLADTRT